MCNFKEKYIYFNGVLISKSTMRIVGSMRDTGYITTGDGNFTEYCHRIVWEMHCGNIPEGYEIDHVNHDRSDNRIENLRIVKKKDNLKNKRKYKNNTSGITGVSIVNTKGYRYFMAKIKVNGKQKCQTFKNIIDAMNKRIEWEVLYGMHKNHGA